MTTPEGNAPAPEGNKPPEGGNDKPWFDGWDAEERGYLENRGLDKKTASEAAREAVRSHRAAEAKLGVPADRLLRLPKDGNDPEWAKVWERLGRPADANGYDFSGVKYKNGDTIEDDVAERARNAAAKANLTREQAGVFMREMIGLFDEIDENSSAEKDQQVAKEQDELRTNWGGKFAQNMLAAKRVAALLGVSGEEFDAMTQKPGVGVARLVEQYRKVATLIGEDEFIGDGHGGRISTVNGAKERLAALKENEDWLTNFHNGRATEVAEFNRLTEIIANG